MRETSGAESTADASVGSSSARPAHAGPAAGSPASASGAPVSPRGEGEPSGPSDARNGAEADTDARHRVLAHVDDVAVARSNTERLVVLALARPDAKPFAIEGTGVIIWDELDGARSLARIAGDLAEEFGADAAVIEHDVASFAVELESRGLVTRR